MKKTVLNWMGQAVAVVAISATAATAVMAQTSGGLTVDQAFARELKLVEGLKVYNDQLAKQLVAQQTANGEIQVSIGEAANLEPQVVPLLNKMLTALEKFVQADLPFHKDDRLESIGRLKGLMVAPEASTSDRFRNIMDIYAAETEYGNTYEAYKDTQTVNGEQIEVDMLRIGRVGLYYQTSDQKTSYMWDGANRDWKQLDGGQNRNIRKAIKVAAKTVAPELLSLLVPTPEGA
ncbi:MAG: hypothetical protein ACI9FR_002826 [Cryomorphaceae bacterium]|jgi:hypothetical protein